MRFGDDQNPQPASLMLASKVHHASVLFGVHGQGLDMEEAYPEGIYTTIMELGPKRPSPLWVLGPNSIVVVYMYPLG